MIRSHGPYLYQRSRPGPALACERAFQDAERVSTLEERSLNDHFCQHVNGSVVIPSMIPASFILGRAHSRVDFRFNHPQERRRRLRQSFH